MAYLDDIIIFSKTKEEHLQQLEIIFQRLCEAGLKLKWSKCSFMKLHIEYLGHLISENGIEPMPDKLSAIKEMPVPRSPKEIKQFLGLVGYYRKFIPRFSDVTKPLTRLTRHDILFQWCKKCEFAFQSLKNALCTKLILKFADPQKPYILFTDARKYAWAGVLTQPYTKDTEGKVVTTHHPVTYVSGLFGGSQLNRAALTKEAYAIYICGIAWDTRHSGCAIAAVLLSVHGHFRKFCGGHTSDTACHLSCRRYIFKGHCDIICDVTVLHVC